MDRGNIVQEAVIKAIPKKRNAKRDNGYLRKKEVKGKAENERYTHLNVEFQRIARRDKKTLITDQCKDIEKNNIMGRLEITSRNLEIPREHFM